MKERFIIGLVIAAVLVGVTAATSLADPNLGPVAPHRHFLKQPDGTLVPFGPQVCDHLDNPGVVAAFAQFHNNLHIATASSIGPVAPGLHNQQGGELVAVAGCG